MLARRTIEGEVIQVIPPEDLNRYAIWGRFMAHVREQYVLVVRTDRRVGFLPTLLNRVVPWRTVGAPVVVAKEADVREGDEVRIEAREVEDHEDVWVPLGRDRRVGETEVVG